MRRTIRGAWTVASFETRRSMTLARGGLWLVLAGFPIAVIAVVYFSAREQLDQSPEGVYVWQALIFALTQVMVALSALLWASPALQVELENRTWHYTATRPYGRRSMLLGRYLVTLLWAGTANGAAVLVCCLLAGVAAAIPALLAATLLGCLGYASLYSLLAVLFPKRAMSVAFGLTLFIEGVFNFIPAMVHNFSIEFHLRSVLWHWLWDSAKVPPEVRAIFSESPPWVHVAALLTYSAVLLVIAVVIIESRETPGDEI